MDRNDERAAVEARDPGEVLQRVVRQVRAEPGVGKPREPDDQQGVAVRRRARDEAGRDNAAASRAIIDDYGLTKRAAQRRREYPRDRIVAAAGREGYDHAHRL